MSARRIAALRAMAEQDDSPAERDIARAKLRELAAKERRQPPDWERAWADIEEHERLADEMARRQQEGHIAELVRRWEQGTFRGMTVGADGAGPRIGK